MVERLRSGRHAAAIATLPSAASCICLQFPKTKPHQDPPSSFQTHKPHQDSRFRLPRSRAGAVVTTSLTRAGNYNLSRQHPQKQKQADNQNQAPCQNQAHRRFFRCLPHFLQPTFLSPSVPAQLPTPLTLALAGSRWRATARRRRNSSCGTLVRRRNRVMASDSSVYKLLTLSHPSRPL
jgi:hypothetical protein